MRSTITVLTAALLSTVAFAQQPAPGKDHAAHHPDAASAPATAQKKHAGKPKAPAAKAPASAAAGGRGMAGDMGKMHDEAHKPGGMHDQMHGQMHGKDGKDGKTMSGPMSAMPAASAASQ